MNKLTYDAWLEATIDLFEETADGVKALGWLETEDFLESFERGLTPTQTYDHYVIGYFF